MSRATGLLIALVFAMSVTLPSGPALAQGKKSGAGPCRIGAQALISMLDDKDDNSADYRHAYEAVTQTCGPPAPRESGQIAAVERGACRDLALRLLDIIEDGKMNTQGFMRARVEFAQSCAPR